MKWLWYIAQALFIGWLVHGVWISRPGTTAGELAVLVGIAIALCAFLTACLTHLWDWAVRRLRGLRRHNSEASRDSLSLTGTRSSTTKAAEHLDRIRIGK